MPAMRAKIGELQTPTRAQLELQTLTNGTKTLESVGTAANDATASDSNTDLAATFSECANPSPATRRVTEETRGSDEVRT